MTGDEAIHLIGVLKGLIPTLTSEQASYLKREFLRFERPPVERAIDQHAKVYSIVNIARLFEQIRDAGVQPQEWRKQFEAERDRVNSETSKVDAALRSLSDEELERCKLDALAQLDPKGREFIEKLDPRKSPTLRALIYRRLLVPAAAR